MCSTDEYNITKYTINDEVRELLNAIAEKHGFKEFNLEINKGISKGDGYVGLATNVRICNSNNPSETLNFHVKSASRENGMRELIPIAEMFSTEIYMYNTVFPYLKDLEIRQGLTPSTFTPNFFGSILNKNNEVLILEDLKKLGYRMHDCSKPLDSQHIRLVIIEYAKYHSLSFALRYQQPEVFEKLQPNLNNLILKIITDLKDAVISRCTNILNFISEVDSKKLRSFLQNIDSEFKELLSPPIDEYSVVVHGDCWVNNILFQYSEESCNPTDVRLIDFQVSHLAPPVLDLAYFLFACSSEQDINQCKEYLKLYHKILSGHLKNLGCDANDLYPYSVFMKQWNKFAKFAVIITPIVLLSMLRTETEIVDFEELSKTTGFALSEAFMSDSVNNEEYNRRLKIIISYLVKNDLLSKLISEMELELRNVDVI